MMVRQFGMALCLVFSWLASNAFAGLGPENICVVVNARSWASRTVANHYAELRQIPSRNIIEIDWPWQIDTSDLAEFRLRVLVPVLKTIQERGLAPQIDAIVYSSDFPYAVRYATGKTPADRFKVASITSLTAFAPAVLEETPPDFGRLLNPYAAQAMGDKNTPSQGFRSRVGRPGATEGEPIYLSAMLAYTSGRGNSVREAIAYLDRAAKADGTAPRGTVYYCRNSDVRSTTREPGFAPAIAQLEKLGVQAEVLNGQLPNGKRDVAGAMIGAAQFDWKRSGATILPGAICENLTSYGGILHPRKGQTPLSEFLRHGAAGASGTVVEPYAIAAKFPDARIHVFYAEGATLVESFYQSTLAPYQLLVVGEPLCAPWAKTPTVKLTGLNANETLDAPREVRATIAKPSAGYSAASCEWYLDGLRVATKKPDEAYSLDPSKFANGWHELRAVVIGDHARATQARAIVPFLVTRKDVAAVTAEIPSQATWGESVTVKAKCPGAVALELKHNSTNLQMARGDQATMKLDTAGLGLGPVRLQVVALDRAGNAIAESAPAKLEVAAPQPLRAAHPPVSSSLRRGLEIAWGRESNVAMSTGKGDWLAKAGVPTKTPFTVTSWFEVDRDDLYQFQVRFNGQLTLSVDGQELFSKNVVVKEMNFVPVALKAGPHLLEMKGNAIGKAPACDLRFGATPVDYLESTQFRHVP